MCLLGSLLMHVKSCSSRTNFQRLKYVFERYLQKKISQKFLNLQYLLWLSKLFLGSLSCVLSYILSYYLASFSYEINTLFQYSISFDIHLFYFYFFLSIALYLTFVGSIYEPRHEICNNVAF